MYEANNTRIRLRKDVFVAGTVMFAGGAIGVLGQIYGMIDSYRTIGAKASPTPEDLAVGVKISLASWVVGGAVGMLGAIMLIRALNRLHRFDREEQDQKGAAWS